MITISSNTLKRCSRIIMMGNKKRIIVVIACIIALATIVGTTYAYLSGKDNANNPISVGENTIEVDEEFELPKELVPGISYTKSPKVTNTGNMDCYVRMCVYYSDESVSRYTTINFDTTNWTYNPDDGYYYYHHIVHPGESSTPLFTEVTILSQIDNGDGTFTDVTQDDLIDYDIIIYAESVQAADYSSATEAWQAFNIDISNIMN